MNSNNKKLIKLLVITLIVGLVIVGLVIGFLLMKESSDPTVIAKKIEQERLSNGYYTRVSELSKFLHQDNDSAASAILETISEITSINKINKLEQGGKRGNYSIYIDDYILDVLIRGGILEEIRIGNSLIYKKSSNKSDKSVAIQEKLYTFTEYDTVVQKFSKGLKVSKAVGAKNFEILTSLDILSFTDIKKLKSDDASVTRYKGLNMKMPLEITLTGETISKVEIVHDAIGRLEVYNKSNESKDKQTIKKFTPIYGERMFIPDSLSYQVGQLMGSDTSIRFPVTINTGDDSWLIIKNGPEYYIEIKGDVTKSGSTKSMEFVIRKNTESQEIIYVKAGNKIIKGKK